MQHLVGKQVQFTSKIEDLECYPEEGMRATIKSIYASDTRSDDPSEHIYDIKFDFTEFDKFNKAYETANYFGMDRIPNKTAREAGYYNTIEEIYFTSPEVEPFESYFTVLNPKQSALIEAFKVSGHSNYVEWLENQIIANM